jgi:DNA repair exonuclease SbcCD ATPase subunit
MADDNTDNTAAANHSIPDPFALAIGLCQIAANAKAIEPALKRLRKLGRDIEKAQQKLAAVTAQAEQINAKLDARAAALDERDRTLTQREDEFSASLQEARDNLRGYYDSIAQADRQLRYRILSHADLLHGFNERLQSLPDWQQIRQLVPDLPPDLPATPAAEVVTENVREDWSGNIFSPSTLTRSVSHKVASQ